MTEWIPIEDAPRDGSWLILARIAPVPGTDITEPQPRTVWWVTSGTWFGSYWSDGIARLMPPTHYIPMIQVPDELEKNNAL